MLVAAAFALTLLSPPRDNPVTQKLVATAAKLGWQRAGNASPAAPYKTVNETFTSGSHRLTFEVAKGKMPTLHPPTSQLVDEPRLNKLGLLVIVPDYTNKRIGDMKTYAVYSGMTISGKVGTYHVHAALEPPRMKPASSQTVASKEAAKVYEDTVKMVQAVAQALKR